MAKTQTGLPKLYVTPKSKALDGDPRAYDGITHRPFFITISGNRDGYAGRLSLPLASCRKKQKCLLCTFLAIEPHYCMKNTWTQNNIKPFFNEHQYRRRIEMQHFGSSKNS